MQIQVPLKDLKFGHDAADVVNARVAGRMSNIETLAANIHARGLIEPLIVVDGGSGAYFVSDGNRRLAALQMIHGDASAQMIECKLREVDAAGAFEDSLTAAVLAEQLHPVDQFEAFAKLEARGKSHEAIAHHFGMSEKQVRQALALGRLSPKIRDTWRKGDIKREVAQAFTLALEHKAQDKLFARLQKENRLMARIIQQELGANMDCGALISVVGVAAYRARGGQVTEDLFGSAHVVSDPALLSTLVDELLDQTCERLRSEGWSWAEREKALPQSARFWPRSEPQKLIFEGDEEQRLTAIRAQREALEEDDAWDFDVEQRLDAEIEVIEEAARLRSFSDRQKKACGCIVGIEDEQIVILSGLKRPAEASGKDDAAPASGGKRAAKDAEAPAEPEISNALLHRLSLQLTHAAATALVQDEQLALSVLLAGVGCYADCGAKVSITGLGARGGLPDMLGSEEMPKALSLAKKLKPAERVTLLAQVAAAALDFQGTSLESTDQHDGPAAICNAIDPAALNAALRGAFDAKDYFAGVSKALGLKAIEEALGPDVARQQAKKGKTEIVAFAIVNVPTTGWLPVQLRAKGYDGPPVGKAMKSAAKKPPKKAAAKKKSARKR